VEGCYLEMFVIVTSVASGESSQQLTLDHRVPCSSLGAPTTQSPQTVRFPYDAKQSVSARIFGLSLPGFLSLEVSRRLSGDFWCPVSGSQNSVPGGWVLSPQSWDSRGSDCEFFTAAIRFVVQRPKRDAECHVLTS
jgi:hypothetical protein